MPSYINVAVVNNPWAEGFPVHIGTNYEIGIDVMPSYELCRLWHRAHNESQGIDETRVFNLIHGMIQ